MNYDLNVNSHIPYKPLQDCDYKEKKKLCKTILYARIKVLVFKISYMGYSKLCYALLDLKKVMSFAYFKVIINIEFELFNY